MAPRASAMLAVTIDAETLVPELTVHRPSRPSPKIYAPAVTKSGLRVPTPSSRDQVVMPRDEKLATFVRVASNEPIPMTLVKSPGLFRVPWKGPSLPIADTIMTPCAVSSLIFSINGMSRKSLDPFERLTMSISSYSTKLKASKNHEV